MCIFEYYLIHITAKMYLIRQKCAALFDINLTTFIHLEKKIAFELANRDVLKLRTLFLLF